MIHTTQDTTKNYQTYTEKKNPYSKEKKTYVKITYKLELPENNFKAMISRMINENMLSMSEQTSKISVERVLRNATLNKLNSHQSHGWQAWTEVPAPSFGPSQFQRLGGIRKVSLSQINLQ